MSPWGRASPYQAHAPMLVDFNHPRRLLVLWRHEATQLRGYAERTSPGERGLIGRNAFTVRAAALEQCAEQLENRLLWSGMLDEAAEREVVAARRASGRLPE